MLLFEQRLQIWLLFIYLCYDSILVLFCMCSIAQISLDNRYCMGFLALFIRSLAKEKLLRPIYAIFYANHKIITHLTVNREVTITHCMWASVLKTPSKVWTEKLVLNIRNNRLTIPVTKN